MIRGVIFDLDGTIAETHGMAIDLIGEAIVAGGGPDLEPREIMAYFGRNEQGIFASAVGSGWEHSWDYYLDAYGERHQACGEPFPGIPALLEELGSWGSRIGLITAKTLTTGRISLEVLGVHGYFEDVIGGEMESVTKRNDIARLVARWSLTPHDVVYIGDTASDMHESTAAGVWAAGACWSEYADCDALAAAGAHGTFKDVEELRRWLRQRIPGAEN